MALKIDYKNMSPAVRKSLEAEQTKGEPIIRKKKQCPGGENCKFPNILCTECELEH